VPIISIAAFGEVMAQHIAQNVGMTVDSGAAEKLLIAKKKSTLIAWGRDPSDATISRKSLARYHSAITFSHSELLPIVGPSVTQPPWEKTNA
jgi:hypothetical protein